MRYEIIQHKQPIINDEIQLDLDAVLGGLSIPVSRIIEGGGGLSWISKCLQAGFRKRGWHVEHRFPGHVYKLDCIKERVALDIEWNNKDTFYDRDLASFRALHEQGLIDCGIIVTRSTSLQPVFKRLVQDGCLSKDKFVSTTTHADRLKPRLNNGAAGACPIVVYAIREPVLMDDRTVGRVSDEFFSFG